MAIPMPIVQDIRRLDRQGMSRAQIARRLHVDRGTVAKYADMEDCSPKPKADRRYGSKIDPYAHLVDEWLEADRLLPRKQRHTIGRVHDRLLAETDYDGEYLNRNIILLRSFYQLRLRVIYLFHFIGIIIKYL